MWASWGTNYVLAKVSETLLKRVSNSTLLIATAAPKKELGRLRQPSRRIKSNHNKPSQSDGSVPGTVVLSDVLAYLTLNTVC